MATPPDQSSKINYDQAAELLHTHSSPSIPEQQQQDKITQAQPPENELPGPSHGNTADTDLQITLISKTPARRQVGSLLGPPAITSKATPWKPEETEKPSMPQSSCDYASPPFKQHKDVMTWKEYKSPLSSKQTLIGTGSDVQTPPKTEPAADS